MYVSNTVSVDVNYRAKLWSRYDAGPVLLDLVSRADIVFAGPDEAAIIVDGPPVAGLAKLDRMVGDGLEVAYRDGGVIIYEVTRP